MLSWISENLATILVCLVLLGIVAAIVLGMRRRKKKGESSCGCSCSGCALHGQCHHND